MRKFSLRLDEMIIDFCDFDERCTVSSLVSRAIASTHKYLWNTVDTITLQYDNRKCYRLLTSVYITDDEYLFVKDASKLCRCSMSKVIHFVVYQYIRNMVGVEYYGELLKTSTKSN